MPAGSADEGIDPRDARIAVSEAIVTELTGKATEFAAKNAELEAITAKIVQRIEKLGRSSRNSHLPPSSDGPGAAGRNKTKPETKGKRKRGGQKGHRGAHRLLLPPDVIGSAPADDLAVAAIEAEGNMNRVAIVASYLETVATPAHVARHRIPKPRLQHEPLRILEHTCI